MLGVGKLIGGALKAVGLEKLTPFVSLAVNAFTGNWAGVAMDVAGLAARLTGNKFLNKVAQFAPIAQSFMGGAGGAGLGSLGKLFQGGRITNLFQNFKNLTQSFNNIKQGFETFQQGVNAVKGGNIFDGASKIFKAFETVEQFVEDRNTFANRSADAYRQLGFGNIYSS